MKHVQDELNRIGERLRAPNPYEHAALFAAQQALCWAADPEAFASPVDSIVGSEGEPKCYSALCSPLPSLDTASRSE